MTAIIREILAAISSGWSIIAHPDELNAINMVARAATGKNLPSIALGKEGAPYATRFKNAIDRGWDKI